MESTIYPFYIKDINSVSDATNISATQVFSFAFYSLVSLVLKRQIPIVGTLRSRVSVTDEPLGTTRADAKRWEDSGWGWSPEEQACDGRVRPSPA